VSEARKLPDAIRVEQCPRCKAPNALVTYARTQRGTGTIHESPRSAKCPNERCFYFDPSVGWARSTSNPKQAIAPTHSVREMKGKPFTAFG
jgi:hypothetical protein